MYTVKPSYIRRYVSPPGWLEHQPSGGLPVDDVHPAEDYVVNIVILDGPQPGGTAFVIGDSNNKITAASISEGDDFTYARPFVTVFIRILLTFKFKFLIFGVFVFNRANKSLNGEFLPVVGEHILSFMAIWSMPTGILCDSPRFATEKIEVGH